MVSYRLLIETRFQNALANNVSTLVIPDSVTSIGSNAFSGNSSIDQLVIGNGLTNIPSNFFKDIALNSVVIGNSVTSIGEGALNLAVGDVFFMKPAQENFSVYDFPSITTIYACDGQADDGTLLNCEDAYPDDGIEVPQWGGDQLFGPDYDNDGILNEFDAFPHDPTEHQDTDNDGIGNNTDFDDDNDGVADEDDYDPHDPKHFGKYQWIFRMV